MGFDGGSRPGEGGGAAAHVVDEDGVVLWAARRYIAGRATNQLAESEACNMGARKAVELARARGSTLIRMYGDSMFVLRAVAGQLVCSDAAIGASTGETAAIIRSAACDVQLIHVPRERNSDADRGAGAAQDLRASADSDDVGVALLDMQGGVEPSVAALPRGGAGSDGWWEVDYEVEGFSEQHVRLPQVACVGEVRRGVTQAAAKLLDMARRARLMERVGEGHRATILSAGAFGSGEFLGVFPGSRPTGWGDDTAMEGRHFVRMVALRNHVPMADIGADSKCTATPAGGNNPGVACGKPLDVHGVHARCCKAGGGGEYARHQSVVRVVQRMLEAAGLKVWVDAKWGERTDADKVCIADLGPEGGSQRTDPATGKRRHLWMDLLVEGADGKKQAVDVMITCAHRKVPGRRSAVQAGEAAKYAKNGASCAGHMCRGVADPIHFRPFVLDDLGALGTDARALVVWATAAAKAHCGVRFRSRHWLRHGSVGGHSSTV